MLNRPAAALDPFAVAVARGQLEEVAERCASTPRVIDRRSDLDAARAIARVLRLSAEQLGITESAKIDDLLRQIFARARSGGLSPGFYRVAWILAHPPRAAAPTP
jgi:hypothetical protein